MSNIMSVEYVGNEQTYDLEVDHIDHQYYLANGALTSNSHSIMYSMISYQTAYLKAHFPIEFLMANLMSELESNTKDSPKNVEKIKQEIRSYNVNILPPNLNTSNLSYELISNNELLTGLDALKFVGDDAIRDIIEKRPFKDFFDFMNRVDSSKVRANTIQALAASGCLDIFGLSRKNMFLYCSDYRKKLQAWKKKHNPETDIFTYNWESESEWKLSERYALEKHYMGEAFICKKEHAYDEFFKKNMDFVPIKLLRQLKDKDKVEYMKGLIVDSFTCKIKKATSKYLGHEMLKLTIEDFNGDRCSLTIFPDNLQKIYAHAKARKLKDFKLEEGIAIAFDGTVNFYEDEFGIVLSNFYTFAYPPKLPSDLKAKKVASKRSKSEDKEEVKENVEELIEEIEEEFYEYELTEDSEDEEDND